MYALHCTALYNHTTSHNRADQHCKNTEGEPKETPPYMLTESLSTQRLWHQTAGRRPRQPSTEREFFEQMWQKNFSESSVSIHIINTLLLLLLQLCVLLC
jgi:hypothetical protein